MGKPTLQEAIRLYVLQDHHIYPIVPVNRVTFVHPFPANCLKVLRMPSVQGGGSNIGNISDSF